MPGPFTFPVAKAVPFSGEGADPLFTATDVEAAIIEARDTAPGKQARAIINFWQWNSNSTTYMYIFGQTLSSETPYPVSKACFLRELSCSGTQNNTTSCAHLSVYAVPNLGKTITLGVLPTGTSQGLTWTQTDFPAMGYVRINFVNNGASKPLAFSEDTATRIVTVQLATNSGGTITTTRTQLVNAFRLNNSISLLYKISGSGTTLMTAGSLTLSGGSDGNAIAAIVMRATGAQTRIGINKQLNLNDNISAYVQYDQGTHAPIALFGNLLFTE